MFYPSKFVTFHPTIPRMVLWNSGGHVAIMTAIIISSLRLLLLEVSLLLFKKLIKDNLKDTFFPIPSTL